MPGSGAERNRFRRCVPNRLLDAPPGANAACLFVGLEAIAHPGFSNEKARARRFRFEFVAQLLHVDAQVMRLFDMRRPPDLTQQLAMRQDHAGVPRQHRQQAELDRRQADLPTRGGHDAPLEVHLDLPQLQRLAL